MQQDGTAYQADLHACAILFFMCVSLSESHIGNPLSVRLRTLFHHSANTVSPASTRAYLKSNDYRAELGMPAGLGM